MPVVDPVDEITVYSAPDDSRRAIRLAPRRLRPQPAWMADVPCPDYPEVEFVPHPDDPTRYASVAAARWCRRARPTP